LALVTLMATSCDVVLTPSEADDLDVVDIVAAGILWMLESGEA